MSQNPGVKESWYRLPLPIARKAHPRAPDSGYRLGWESLAVVLVPMRTSPPALYAWPYNASTAVCHAREAARMGTATIAGQGVVEEHH